MSHSATANLPRQHRPRLVRRQAVLALAALAALVLTAGCSRHPIAYSQFNQAQPVLDSARHWQVVSNDVGSAISAYLIAKTGRNDPVTLKMERNGDSLFADAFMNGVATALVQKGHAVSFQPRPDVVEVTMDMLIVPSSPKPANAAVPGAFTMLAAGASVFRALADPFPWGVTALGLGVDAVLARPQETDTEMMLTISTIENGFFTFRTNAVYYINGMDLWHYESEGARRAMRNLNDMPATSIGYDLAGKPFVQGR